MFGANYQGQPYYGQGPAVGTTFVLKTVSASVTTTADISFQLLITKMLSASVTTTASILRTFGRELSASVTATASISDTIIKALNVISGITKFWNGSRNTRGLNSVNTTKPMTGLKRTTRRVKDE